MISKKQIKDFAYKKYSKKIGKAPLLEIEKQTESFIKELIRKAARNSSFSGRNTLKPKDFD